MSKAYATCESCLEKADVHICTECFESAEKITNARIAVLKAQVERCRTVLEEWTDSPYADSSLMTELEQALRNEA